MRIFVSYSHKQKDWVLDWLLPALDPGGHEVLFDRRRFTADESLWQVMDASQDQADWQILVFSKDYLASEFCLREFRRACAQDRALMTGIRLEDCVIPPVFGGREPLDFFLGEDHMDLRKVEFASTIQLAMPQPSK